MTIDDAWCAVPPHPTTAPSLRTSPAATASLVLGVAGLVALGPVTGVPAMILAGSARREIAASNGWLLGIGTARAGFWTGVAGSVWGIVLVVLLRRAG